MDGTDQEQTLCLAPKATTLNPATSNLFVASLSQGPPRLSACLPVQSSPGLRLNIDASSLSPQPVRSSLYHFLSFIYLSTPRRRAAFCSIDRFSAQLDNAAAASSRPRSRSSDNRTKQPAIISLERGAVPLQLT